MRFRDLFTWLTVAGLGLGLAACTEDGGDDHDDDHGDHDDGGHGHENEVITTLTLTFEPESAGGATVTAAFSDPDGNGIMSPTIDDIGLVLGESYTLDIQFSNELEDPAEDITEEIREEANEHQVFIYGDVTGPGAMAAGALVEHMYADLESDYGEAGGDDLPVGLVNAIQAVEAGSGDFKVMLRHIPESNNSAQKTAGLAEEFAAGEALPGDPDADVTFAITVQ